MSITKKLLQAASGNAGGDNLYVEDVFSTYLYDGQATSLAIDNGLDLDGKGGLTWIKARTDAASHSLSLPDSVSHIDPSGTGMSSMSIPVCSYPLTFPSITRS